MLPQIQTTPPTSRGVCPGGASSSGASGWLDFCGFMGQSSARSMQFVNIFYLMKIGFFKISANHHSPARPK